MGRWKLEGRLHLWYYPQPVEGLEGWHLNGDALACQSMADLIDRMLAAPSKIRQVIPVSAPSRMRVGHGHEWRAATQLLLECPKDEVAENFWHMERHQGDVVALSAGAEKMRRLRESLLGLPQWKDDFALGPNVDMHQAADRKRWDRECLWFWTKIY